MDPPPLQHFMQFLLHPHLPAPPQTAKQEVVETTKEEVAETAKQEVVEKRREKVDGTKQSPEQTFLKLLITEVIQSTFKA